MAIVVGGRKYRTLEDKLYVNGSQVKKAFANGIQVYPESDKYVLWVSGSTAISHKYRQLEQIYEKIDTGRVDSNGNPIYEVHASSISWWSGSGWMNYNEATNVVNGSVDMLVVSDKPIAVYDTNELRSWRSGIPFPKPDQYGNGSSTLHVFAPIWGGGANSENTGRVDDYPDSEYAWVSFRTTGDASIAIRAWATTLWQPQIMGSETTGSYYLHCYDMEHPNQTDLVWQSYSGNEVVFGYEDTDWSEEMAFRWTSGSAGEGISRVYERAYLLRSAANIDLGGGSISTGDVVVGVRLTGGTFVTSSGIGYYSENVPRYFEIGRIPLRNVEYSNNPSVLSATFDKDPPTEKAPDEIIDAWKSW